MACDSELYKIDSIRIDGIDIPFEDGSATIEGAAGFQSEVVASASGPDFTRRTRVARIIRCKLQFGPATTPEQFSGVCGAQIVLTNLHTGRRVRAGKCNFGSMGDIGSGSVDLTFNCLTPLQWL